MRMYKLSLANPNATLTQAITIATLPTSKDSFPGIAITAVFVAIDLLMIGRF
jgi:hypothetical protein